MSPQTTGMSSEKCIVVYLRTYVQADIIRCLQNDNGSCDTITHTVWQCYVLFLITNRAGHLDSRARPSVVICLIVFVHCCGFVVGANIWRSVKVTITTEGLGRTEWFLSR